MHLYLFDRADGAPVRRHEGADRRAPRCPASGSPRSRSTPRKAGPGHYVVDERRLRRRGRLEGRGRAARERVRRAPHQPWRSPSNEPQERTHERSDPHAAVAAAALAAPAAAQAHVTLQPEPGAGRRLHAAGRARAQRARRRRHDQGRASSCPPGFVFASYEPVPGWTVKVDEGEARQAGQDRRRRGHRGRSTRSPGPRTAQGIRARRSSRTSGCRVRVPGQGRRQADLQGAADLQGGEVVRWIGPEDADKPAPVVTARRGRRGRRPRRARARPPPAAARPRRAAAHDDGRLRQRSPSPRWSSAALGLLAADRRACAPSATQGRQPHEPHRSSPSRSSRPACLAAPGERRGPRRDQVVLAEAGQHAGRSRPRVRAKVTFKARITDGEPDRQARRRQGEPRLRPARLASAARSGRVLRSGLRAGRYTATARWLDTDGHVQSKSWSFRLR